MTCHSNIKKVGRMEERFKKIFNWKNVLRGSVLFLMFTIIGLLTSFLWKGSKDAFSTLRSINLRFLALMFILIFFDWVFMGYRVFVLASKMSDRVGFWDCFKANLANTCIGAITPSQTGGWAGQLYILYRSGVSLAGGATITVITFSPRLDKWINYTVIKFYGTDFFEKLGAKRFNIAKH